LAGYVEGRDRPGDEGVSRLSPHLHFGELSPRRIWYAVCESLATRRGRAHRAAGEAFLRQLIWREFADQQLFHFPVTPTEPLNEDFIQCWGRIGAELSGADRGACCGADQGA